MLFMGKVLVMVNGLGDGMVIEIDGLHRVCLYGMELMWTPNGRDILKT